MTSNQLSPALERRLRTQVDTWRNDLLTLDRRQKLVYFKHTKTASLEIASPAPGMLMAGLESPLVVTSEVEPSTAGRAVRVAEKDGAAVAAACRRLDLTAQQVYADRGFWTLYLGLGMLQWVDPDDGKTAYAPVVLCPVELNRKGAQQPYHLVRNEDDVVVNPALRLHLEKSFGIRLPELDLDDPDLPEVLSSLGRAVRDRPGWEVQQRAVLTTFSFHKEAIYRDLEDHESSVTAHPVVRLVALGVDAPDAWKFGFEAPGSRRSIDEVHPPEDLVSILDADSSQRACILAAREGHSFVMDGPPGTGKSQTIANIVAELMTAGRRVLFVSEKAAALDVVRDRLSDRGLGDFLLELHSHSATRKEVVKQLNEALTQRMSGRGAMTESEKQTLRATREELSDYADAVNLPRTMLGRSLHSLIGRLAQLDSFAHKPVADPLAWVALTAARLDEILDVAEQLSNAWRPVSEGESFYWQDLATHQHSRAGLDDASTATGDAARAASALVDRCRAVDEDLGTSWPLDLPSARRRLRLLELLEARPSVPTAWLTHPDPEALRQHAARLRRAVREHEDATAALGALVGLDHVSEIDVDACAAVTTPSAAAPWSPDDETTSTQIHTAVDLLATTPQTLVSVLEDARQLGGMLGVPADRLTLRRAVELAHLASLGGSAALPERSWLNPAVQAALDESLKVLGPVVELVNERRTAMEQVFRPEALEVDLPGLEVRFREAHTGFRTWGAAARADKRLLKSVTVNGKADKAVRGQLAEAVAWQKAERALSAAEKQHAERLGSYYEESSTDFGRLSQAIDTARRAIELAGNDLNSGPMADQLGKDGTPDPRLTVVAQHLLSTSGSWVEHARATLGDQIVSDLQEAPLDVAAARATQNYEALHEVVAAVDHVTAVARRPVTLAEARSVHMAAGRLSLALVTVWDDYEGDARLLGDLYTGLTTDWHDLDKALDWLEEVRSTLDAPALPRQAQQMMRPVVLSSEVRSRLDEHVAARDAWTSLFAGPKGTVWREDLDSDLGDAAELLETMQATCVTDVAEWDAFVTATTWLADAGLDQTLRHLQKKRSPAEHVVPSVEWAVMQGFTEGVIESDPRLRVSRAKDRDARAAKFRHLDQTQVQTANASAAAAISARRPSSMTGTSAQLIRREAQKKTRHLPIRELLSRTHEIVQELKPCFMMSPLSVSQFLPGDMTFDAVIFDEASQVLPSDAINCIYRGQQLIVAGDEKQLPPTAFFAQAGSDEDVDEELDLFESVLKSCKSSLPSLPLTWHYRSQHESLITFSNYRFYAPDGDALQSFPGATFSSPDLGVASYVVNGVYMRGGARNNPVEAEAVVDRVVFHQQHHPDLSIGVVTFSSAQEAAVSAAIERRSLTEPVLQGLLDDHDRLNGFFVKNLENVQGDERDIILFSLGYGPDETGKFTMNFGPVGRQGGWRRLNVAVTRARRRVEVISSFRAADMRDTANESLAHLRAYLEFAERGVAALGDPPTGADTEVSSDLEDDVMAAISSWGYEVEKRVGSAGYRIDLAVKHPDKPGEYVMAVECDGPSYHSAASARDRDRLRTSVLRRLGWQVYRVWGVSWYRDRALEVARLRAAIDGAVAGVDSHAPDVPAATTPLEVEVVDLDAPPAWATTYRTCTRSARTTRYGLGDVEARPALQDYLVQLLEDEAPVHRDLVYKRVRDAFSVGRVGSNVKTNIEFCARRVSVQGAPATIDSAGFFRAGTLEQVRVPQDGDAVRTVLQTPPEELDLAVVNVVRDAVTAEDEAVATAVARLFGWRRAGNDIQVALASSVERCLASGRLSRSNNGGLRAS